MDKKFRVMFIVLICATFALLATTIGYFVFLKGTSANRESVANAASLPQTADVSTVTAPLPTFLEPVTISNKTKMVYEYVYKDDGTTTSTSEIAPYFLYDMDEKRVASIFSDWEIVSFTSAKVVMRKTLEGESEQHYVVGVLDGYIAVFYQTPINGSNLKEITQTPIGALDTGEQAKLEAGVLVVGEEELLKMLEDYTS